jgi:hypothetical protein
MVTIRALSMEVAHFAQELDALQLAKQLNGKYPGGIFKVHTRRNFVVPPPSGFV